MSFHKQPKDDTQHQNHLDGAVNILTGNLQEEATRAGLDNHFQRWIEDLKDTNNPELHQIVVDMQALKAHFGGGTIDKSLVSQLLSRLGANTSKAANFADNPNTAQRITNLGEALSAAARQVSSGGQSSPEQDLQQNSAQNS
ncbi:hypothetical protein HNQ93_000264 [Hymenobacter luteus]|uniref:Uncharacterized protein n=2 Tax=Hymenobacter TaxID=89966 RepID=A0A7W9SY92_9BACT|nr:MULTISPECIES: hypothetical protein [Hymenobacter]MBB4600256.1 hypothetical protein [Hymenobacter latericoloratus]MBB6057434.1 hypothetical protein [Hymenobacter luteus]